MGCLTRFFVIIGSKPSGRHGVPRRIGLWEWDCFLVLVITGGVLFSQYLFLSPVIVLPHLLQTGVAYVKWRENRFHLQIGGRNLLPHSGFFAPDVGNVLTQEQAAGIGGIGGALVGGFVAGPLGAILGGVVGD